MRTKTLLLAAAALAAGLASSMAQSSNVFSVNIVGYVNVVAKGNGAFTLIANPLNAATNDLNTIAAGIPNKSTAQVWNGSGFNLATKAGGVWSPNLTITPGTGFFVQTPAGSADATNTFVGSVVIGSGGTNSVNVPTGFSLLGSPVPVGGTLNDTGVGTLNLNATIPNKSSIQVWDNSGSGGFVLSTKAGGSWSPNLSLGVGQGFFISPVSATNWTQILP